MNTSQIKTFAINSRQILKQGVINKISSLGFNPQGEPVFGLPQKIQGATVYAGKILDESFFDAWMALKHRIEVKGIKDVYEEAAYTWFNRLVAIRIMQKNGYIEPVLQYSSEETRIPRIVAEARAGHIVTDMTASDRAKLDELLNDDSKTTEQFTLLIENFCKYNPVIFNCFGGIEKYISILLPDNILAQGGFIDLLNHTTYITDEDYTKSELIGWLYQFYISEKKDEVFDSFKKGKKAEAEDIPAATQIFTPNWIVKYMVQNTIGRIYLDNNPYSELGSEMKYLVGEKTPDEAVLHLDDLADYKMIDPACGSGHILVEAFDLFYSMYREEGYSSRKAVESILRKNIIGIDLDTRAKQLATFALLMKAVKADETFLSAAVMPRIYDMPEPYRSCVPLRDTLPHFFLGEEKTTIDETVKAFELMNQAENLGSIMKFDISEVTRFQIKKRLEEFFSQDQMNSTIAQLVPYFEVILALTDKYTCVVANPPYMGASNMNAELGNYVKAKYPEGKADMFAVFMYVAMDLLNKEGKMGMINMQSWMFLSSFEALRNTFLTEYHVDNMLHLGPRTFDELGGEVVQNTAFVVSKSKCNIFGSYARLIEGNCCAEKESLFFNERVWYNNIKQESFNQIPGNPIGYWISPSIVKTFEDGNPLGEMSYTLQGMIPGNVNAFVRLWHEVNKNKIGWNHTKHEDIVSLGKKWFPYNKGGGFRRWYGNIEHLLNMENDGYDIKNSGLNNNYRLRDPEVYFKPALTWSKIASGTFSARYMPAGCLFDIAGCCIFNLSDITYSLATLNSKVSQEILNVISPTLNYEVDHIKKVPIIYGKGQTINNLCASNVELSKLDWDSHETSWDYKTNELLRVSNKHGGLISELIDKYRTEWESMFEQLHENEEELNRQFIEIYGLQNELTPDVPLEEITILQQGEISIENNEIVWHDDVIIKQLISYAVGCWMGRYRLDKPGLHIAHPNPSSEEVCTYQYNGHDFKIDDDGIIPMMSCDSMFEDNGYNRIVEFIKVAFGEDNFTENLNFIEKALGKSLEDYMMKDFWKDHKKMYQNRPIYWLFSSKKGAFQCMVYMHRMNPYTAERVRTKYLLKHIDDLKGRIATASERAALLTTVERRNLAKMQKDLDECLEYHDVLHEVADQQIGFDLDDGVVVNYAKFGDVLAKIK